MWTKLSFRKSASWFGCLGLACLAMAAFSSAPAAEQKKHPVPAAQPLASETDELQHGVARAEKQVAIKQAAVKLAQAQKAVAEAKVKIAEVSIDQAKASVARWEAESAKREAESMRARQLLEGGAAGVISKQTVEEVEFQMRSAKAQLASAKASVAIAERTVSLAQQEVAVEEARRELAHAKLEASQLRLKQLRKTLPQEPKEKAKSAIQWRTDFSQACKEGVVILAFELTAVAGSIEGQGLKEKDPGSIQKRLPQEPKEKAPASIQWRTDYSQARKEAEDHKKPILLWFHEPASPECEKMEKHLWLNAEMKELIGEKFIPLKLDHDNTVRKYLQDSRTVLTAPDGKVLDTIAGYIEPQELRDRLDKALRAVGPSNTENVWIRLGLKVEPVGAAKVAQASKELHGGMRVLEVRADSPALVGKLRKGDILAGLHEWETLTHESVSIALNDVTKKSIQPVRFVVVRDDDILIGFLELSQVGEPKGQADQ